MMDTEERLHKLSDLFTSEEIRCLKAMVKERKEGEGFLGCLLQLALWLAVPIAITFGIIAMFLVFSHMELFR